MIEFHYETEFRLEDKTKFADWVSRVVDSEQGRIMAVDYIFCSDPYLLEMNKKYLDHDTFTDIITFDYSEGKRIGGDVFISIDRVRENTKTYQTVFQEELLRVMAHGLLHLLGYQDKSEPDKADMRAKEDEKIRMFHVEQ
jgi:rRNA maturation RNase YbeY